MVMRRPPIRMRLAATAKMASNDAGIADSVKIAITVRSQASATAAIRAVALNARPELASGSQRMRRPVVAKVPAAVARAMTTSGMTGIAATRATTPVRQGWGCRSRSHQMPTSGPVVM